MLMSNIESAKLLPAFANSDVILGFCEVFDFLIKVIDSRLEALPCENSAAALAACRDDELAQIASDVGALPCFPDLGRAARENLILQAKLWSRRAGTNRAIEAALNALFDTNTAAVVEHPNYRYSVKTKGFVDADEISIKRFTDCLEAMGHVTCTPMDIEIQLEHQIQQGLCVGAALAFQFEASIQG